MYLPTRIFGKKGIFRNSPLPMSSTGSLRRGLLFSYLSQLSRGGLAVLLALAFLAVSCKAKPKEDPRDPGNPAFWLLLLWGGSQAPCQATAAWQLVPSSATVASEINAVAVDGACNTYVAGTVQGAGLLEFSSSVSVYASYVGSNALVAKFAPDGTPLWAKTVFNAGGASAFYDLALDSAGDVYAVGYVGGTGSYDFGSGFITGAGGSQNAVLVKYSASGQNLGAKGMAANPSSSIFYSVSVFGNLVYAAGSITATGTNQSYTFAGGQTASTKYAASNAATAVLVSYTTDGSAGTATTPTSAANQSSFSSVEASTGGVYVAGSVRGNGNFQFGSLSAINGCASGSNNNAILVNYKGDLSDANWSQTCTSTSNASNAASAFSGVSVAPDGSVYAAGYLQGSESYQFGSSQSQVTGANGASANALLVKFDANTGSGLWSKSPNSAPGVSRFWGVDNAPDGSVFAAGIVYGASSYLFGSVAVQASSATNYNALYLKYDANGTALEGGTSLRGNSTSYYTGLAVDALGRPHLAGYVDGSGNPFDFLGQGPFLNAPFASGNNLLLVRPE